MEPFVIQRSTLPFWGWQPNFQKWLKIFEVVTSKFNIRCPFTSMASKTALPKLHQIAAFIPRINLTYILLGVFEIDPNLFSRDVCTYDQKFNISQLFTDRQGWDFLLPAISKQLRTIYLLSKAEEILVVSIWGFVELIFDIPFKK